LESVYRGNSIQGSNPCLSARISYLFSLQSVSVSVMLLVSVILQN
jgi:hypothetical protein